MIKAHYERGLTWRTNASCMDGRLRNSPIRASIAALPMMALKRSASSSTGVPWSSEILLQDDLVIIVQDNLKKELFRFLEFNFVMRDRKINTFLEKAALIRESEIVNAVLEELP